MKASLALTTKSAREATALSKANSKSWQRNTTRPMTLQPVNTLGNPNRAQKCCGPADTGIAGKTGGHTTAPNTGYSQAPRRSSSPSLEAMQRGINPKSMRLHHCLIAVKMSSECDESQRDTHLLFASVRPAAPPCGTECP
jgi:hypothetical protein